jgi:hypothetical protein
MTGKVLQRRSIVLILDTDSKTADQMAEGAVSFLKRNYKLLEHQIEQNSRSIFSKNFVEVDEK